MYGKTSQFCCYYFSCQLSWKMMFRNMSFIINLVLYNCIVYLQKRYKTKPCLIIYCTLILAHYLSCKLLLFSYLTSVFKGCSLQFQRCQSSLSLSFSIQSSINCLSMYSLFCCIVIPPCLFPMG